MNRRQRGCGGRTKSQQIRLFNRDARGNLHDTTSSCCHRTCQTSPSFQSCKHSRKSSNIQCVSAWSLASGTVLQFYPCRFCTLSAQTLRSPRLGTTGKCTEGSADTQHPRTSHCDSSSCDASQVVVCRKSSTVMPSLIEDSAPSPVFIEDLTFCWRNVLSFEMLWFAYFLRCSFWQNNPNAPHECPEVSSLGL